MPLNKLDNFIKNVEGRILYVNPNDLDSTDSIDNQGNSLGRPFKTIQRALLESARFSYLRGSNNDIVEKTTILLFPGEHTVDNRPGFVIYNDNGTPRAVPPSGGIGSIAPTVLSLTSSSNFDLTQENNILYRFNSINGGVIVPRGTSIVGLDLRKTKIRPKYVPNPTDLTAPNSAIFRVTGACYFWQFSIFDGDETGLVYTDPITFDPSNQSTPTFSHHKLTCFEYADGVNEVLNYGLTDLDMYYSKLSNAFNEESGRVIDEKFPARSEGFAKQRPEWEIVGAFATDPIPVTSIISGNGITASNVITVTTQSPHGLTSDTPIKVKGVSDNDYNVSTKVQNVLSPTRFTYLLPSFRNTLPASPSSSNATITIETDTVSGASPYIFNISLRSIWGMNGMLADGSKASGFRSMVVAQFTAVSLQKDDRAFVKYNKVSRVYEGVNPIAKVTGSRLSLESAQTDSSKVYHLDPLAIYRRGWESSHIKITNDAFIQVVSVFAIGFNKHFDVESGGDASITNSNSNFGQISLNSSGFKKESFAKDNNAFITSIIPPRSIVEPEENVQWLSLDVGLTTSIGIQNHMYLFGFTAQDSPPPILLQGYKIGARKDDKLYVDISGTTYETDIYMCNNVIGAGVVASGNISASKEYVVASQPVNDIFTIGNHNIITGEKIIINSEIGDLPENIVAHQVYYAIRVNPTQIKLATSFTNASLNQSITVYGGSQLRILSRVSDKEAGDIGSPVQYDQVNKNWFIHVNSNNQIYNAFATLGEVNITETTDLAYIKRIPDTRSLDEKIYKIRVVIPKELKNAKTPENGFVIQESKSTGAISDADFTKTLLTSEDFNYNKNPRFITRCTRVSGTVTVVCSLPHNLKINDTIIIRNVTDSTNPTGKDNQGYNGGFDVSSIVDDMTFTYQITRNTGVFTNNINSRTVNLPRFERNDMKTNFYIYRNEVVKEYIEDVQDGIYHLFVLNSDHSVSTEFTDFKYSQSVVDLYPQLDRDNISDNPPAAQTYAKRFPIGEVVTSDLKKSVTRECIDTFMIDFGIGTPISSVATTPTSATLTFPRRHGLSGIVSGAITPGSGYTNGIYYDVKLFNNPGLSIWNGATAKVTVSGGQVTEVDIISRGSGYSTGTLYFDVSAIGNGTGATYNVTSAGISTNINDVVQITGIGTALDYHYRITSVPSSTTVSIARTTGDPTIVTGQYSLVVSPSTIITSSSYNPLNGVTTFVTTSPHGLLSGNKFSVVDSSNNTVGVYIVREKLSVNSFTVVTNRSLSVNNGYILKHGLNSNNAISDAREENFGIRNTPFYNSQTLTLVSFTTEEKIRVTSSVPSTITKRFPLGSYILIDNEIMRIISSTLGGTNNDEISVIRGALGTLKENHDDGSIIRGITPRAIEFRRPSIVRASGHTFEYLGYGSGNYSTSLPQIQITSLTETEEYLAQSQERSAGLVVYTGMNSRGDFYIGNKKLSSATGEERVFDTPIPTVTGSDPAKLSAVFDEITVKDRILVEGGSSGNILSQFDGPVTFNQKTRFKDVASFNGVLRVINDTASTSPLNGALTVKGGVGIQQNLNVLGNTTLFGLLNVNGGLIAKNIRVGISENNTIDTLTGNLILDSVGGTVNVNDNLTVSGISTFTGLVSANGGARIDNIRIGVTDDNTIDTSTGDLILSSAGSKIIQLQGGVSGTRIYKSNNAAYAAINVESLTANRTLTISDADTTLVGGTMVPTTTSINTGDGLSGGGNLSATRTLTVDSTVVRTFGNQTIGGTKTFSSTLFCNGDIVAFASDERLKENVKILDNALDKVMKLSGFTYNFNEIGESFGFDREVTHVGVSAQEIQKVLPEAVAPCPADNKYLTVKYEKIVPLLIEAIKELKEEINELKGVK